MISIIGGRTKGFKQSVGVHVHAPENTRDVRCSNFERNIKPSPGASRRPLPEGEVESVRAMRAKCVADQAIFRFSRRRFINGDDVEAVWRALQVKSCDVGLGGADDTRSLF